MVDLDEPDVDSGEEESVHDNGLISEVESQATMIRNPTPVNEDSDSDYADVESKNIAFFIFSI